MDNLIRLDKSYIKSAAGVLARAFQDDPPMMCFYPDEASRTDNLLGFLSALIRK